MRPELAKATELLRRNTPQSIEQAIALLQNTVYSFSMKVCGHPQDAEDTMQEVLYRSLAHLAKIQEPQALSVWLYTVTRNRCWRMRRKTAHAPGRTFSLDELMPDDAELAHLLQDSGQGPEAHLLQSERHDLLHQAVLRVPPSLRMVLVLHDMEELDTAQVAQILNLQPGTVRVRLHRARLTVRKEMARLAQIAAQAGNPAPPARRPQSPARKSQKTKSRPPACREVFSNLSEYLDGALEPRTCEQMRAHIEACPPCVAFLQSLRQAIDRCRALQANCDPAVAARLRILLTQEYRRMLEAPAATKNASPV